MNIDNQVIRTPDLARMLAVCPATVRNMVRRGDLPAPRKLGASRPHWHRSDLAHVLPQPAPVAPAGQRQAA